jgi:beta-xylosidase
MLAAGVALIVLPAAGCGSPAPAAPSSGAAGAATAGPGSSPGLSSSSASTESEGEASVNPVYDTNFPDPQVVRTANGWLAVATNGNGRNVQTATSTDLRTWDQGADALPAVASWSTTGKVWAPEITQISDAKWAMYYTTIAPDPPIQCVSVAFADKPAGPYTDSSTAPLVCENDQGGSIDASPFTAADGQRYLYWKNDGNAIGVDTWISVQQLSADGSKLAGKPKRLIRQDQPWEGSLIEAPFVREQDGIFHLFYSANDYASADYAVGHATGASPTGTFTKDPEPILVSNEIAAGPGHCALFEADGQVWMVYHAWAPDSIGDDDVGRSMWLSRTTIGPGKSVTVQPPAADPFAAP